MLCQIVPAQRARMAGSARHLVEDVFGARPVRQWVLGFPYPLRFLFATKPDAIGPVLAIVQRVIGGCLADQAGVERAAAQCGAVTLGQRFGSALNLNVHLHMLWLDGVYAPDRFGSSRISEGPNERFQTVPLATLQGQKRASRGRHSCCALGGPQTQTLTKRATDRYSRSRARRSRRWSHQVPSAQTSA